MSPSKVKITQDEDNPIPKDVLADAICKLSDSANALLLSGLNEKAVVALLQDATHIPKKKIQTVLNALGQLRQDYTHSTGATND